jgi:hypothetical protein
MSKTITVNEAISKGKKTLVYLPMAVILAVIIFGFSLYQMKIVPGWSIFITFIFGFLSGWLTWSYFVNKWKIWAYENVRNVNELRRKAIREKLIWESDSWFEKTEFINSEQKIKLTSLEQKFLEKDIYQDDPAVPKETLIFYSKTTLLFLLAISFGIIALGIYFLLDENYLFLILIIIGLYLVYDQLSKLKDTEPQIIINDKGIKLKNEKLVSWRKIHNDEVFAKSNGKSSTNYLAFNNEMIDIDELTIKMKDLEKLLHVYRARFENKKN